ncbi:MAG: hypothetical protein J3Q66DRAFT_413132 [Benniella sp.]|nr:MAG: hypothetical protein J3Q66DRAFT_413132 [Benniella sp.]
MSKRKHTSSGPVAASSAPSTSAREHERRQIDNCYDLCHPLEEQFASRTAPVEEEGAGLVFNVYRKRSVEKERRAKAAIENWRQVAFRRDYQPLGPMFRLQTALSDEYIAKLVANMRKITTPESILSIVKWTPAFPIHVQEVGNILVEINNDVDSNEQPAQRDQLNQQEVSRSSDGRVHRSEDPQPPPAPKKRRTYDMSTISTAGMSKVKRPCFD